MERLLWEVAKRVFVSGEGNRWRPCTHGHIWGLTLCWPPALGDSGLKVRL
jgi:hypothetical protein